MATNSKKTTTTPATNTVPTKKPVAKRVAAVTPSSKTVAPKAAANPVKKAVAATSKKTATDQAKKTIAAATKETAPISSKIVSAPKTEAPASKPAATAKSIPAKNVKKNTVTPEERYKMIATAAFFRAERRGFATGHETEDWSASEAEIEAMLNA